MTLFFFYFVSSRSSLSHAKARAPKRSHKALVISGLINGASETDPESEPSDSNKVLVIYIYLILRFYFFVYIWDFFYLFHVLVTFFFFFSGSNNRPKATQKKIARAIHVRFMWWKITEACEPFSLWTRTYIRTGINLN